LFTTKIHALTQLLGEDFIPPDVAIINRYGVPPKAYVDAALHVAQSFGARGLAFVGDLDPLDLTAFAVLRENAGREAHRIRYLGVGDDWLDLCARSLLRRVDRSLSTSYPYTLKMTAFELAHLQRLLRHVPDLAAVVGPRSWELLASGMKVELEGASNPRLFSNGFSQTLQRFLFRRK
jgi:hypothetical protein